ncbi:MAG: helix-turn-helix domain-containing protein [Ruminococcus sp.]|nr:helix-turn-helix domain-containing protein [Ruminococcus sp.]
MIEKNMLGKFIRIKRENAGLSQKQFAEQLFVTESAVSKWERGVNYPDLTMITEICRVLDVSERELITASEDTSYRRIKKQVLQYERLKKLSFWIPTSVYLLTILICSVCCLTGVMPVSTWLIVLASLACAFLFFPSVTRFVKSKSLIWYLVTSAAGVAVLLTVCGAVTKSIYWVPTAVMGTLLGYSAVFLPIVLKKYSKNGFISTHKTFISFIADTVLTIILVATVQILIPINLRSAELTVLYCFCPLLITGLVVSLRLNGLIKGGICTVIFGICAFLTNYFVGLVYDVPADMAINLSDWATYTNGNVLLTVLVTCAAVGIGLIGCGIKKSRK